MNTQHSQFMQWVQDELQTLKSDAPTWQRALEDRIAYYKSCEAQVAALTQAQETLTARAEFAENVARVSVARANQDAAHVETLTRERDRLQDQLADMTERRDALQRQPSDGFTLLSWQAQALAAEARIARLVEALTQALNGWGCYATRKVEHDDIARLREALSDAPAAPRTTTPEPCHYCGTTNIHNHKKGCAMLKFRPASAPDGGAR